MAYGYTFLAQGMGYPRSGTMPYGAVAAAPQSAGTAYNALNITGGLGVGSSGATVGVMLAVLGGLVLLYAGTRRIQGTR